VNSVWNLTIQFIIKSIGSFIANLIIKFQPLENHTIQAYGYDEEDEYWESEEIENLKDFLTRKAKYNKDLKEALNNK
jgi:hypothetical protein